MLLLIIFNRLIVCHGNQLIGFGDIKRELSGDFINQFYHSRTRRDEIAGEKGFKPLGAMMLYMKGEFKVGCQRSCKLVEKFRLHMLREICALITKTNFFEK